MILAELRNALGLECMLPAIHYVLVDMGLTRHSGKSSVFRGAHAFSRELMAQIVQRVFAKAHACKLSPEDLPVEVTTSSCGFPGHAYCYFPNGVDGSVVVDFAWSGTVYLSRMSSFHFMDFLFTEAIEMSQSTLNATTHLWKVPIL